MANLSHTPEALLGRNDSKNPLTTCKGITSSGRPCRRALAASPNGKRKSSVSALNGVVALVEEDGRVQEADFYCWQHKDQVDERNQQEQQVNKGRKARRKRSAELVPLQERSSIDTLVQRLGIGAVPEEREKRNSRPEKQPKPPRRTETTDFADPASRPERISQAEKYHAAEGPSRKPAKKKPGFWASLCCTASGKDDDYVEIVRHRRRTEQVNRPSQASESPSAPPLRIPQASRRSNTSFPARKPPSPATPSRPSHQRVSSNPQTGLLLSHIPQHCTPQTTSTLLAELIKPISPADEEGYIYIFWLTPQTKDTPSEHTARSLLAPPEKSRRISDVMTEFSYDGDGDDEPSETTRGGGMRGNGTGNGKKTIMLKIGRANNITRRMNEWQRQCGYKLNLVRWYPYIPSSPSPNSPQTSPSRQSLYPDLTQPPTSSRRQSDMVHKVPYVKRVERLIHLELAEKRVLRNCKACGKEHREWFEVEASQEGVKGVDECVRRWVGLAERWASQDMN